MNPMQFIVNQMAPDRPVLYEPKPMSLDIPRLERQPLKTIPLSTEDVAKMRAAGVPWSVLEAKTGMTAAGPTNRLRRAGMHAPRKTKITDKEIRKAAKMRSEGKAWPEVARALGRSKAGIYTACRSKGLI